MKIATIILLTCLCSLSFAESSYLDRAAIMDVWKNTYVHLQSYKCSYMRSALMDNGRTITYSQDAYRQGKNLKVSLYTDANRPNKDARVDYLWVGSVYSVFQPTGRSLWIRPFTGVTTNPVGMYEDLEEILMAERKFTLAPDRKSMVERNCEILSYLNSPLQTKILPKTELVMGIPCHVAHFTYISKKGNRRDIKIWFAPDRSMLILKFLEEYTPPNGQATVWKKIDVTQIASTPAKDGLLWYPKEMTIDQTHPHVKKVHYSSVDLKVNVSFDPNTFAPVYPDPTYVDDEIKKERRVIGTVDVNGLDFLSNR
jgi:hypothetical protein